MGAQEAEGEHVAIRLFWLLPLVQNVEFRSWEQVIIQKLATGAMAYAICVLHIAALLTGKPFTQHI